MAKIIKYRLLIEVFEQDGRPIVHHSTEELNPTMKDIGLVVYKMKQVEQELVDRDWQAEGYEIINNGDDDNGEEEER